MTQEEIKMRYGFAMTTMARMYGVKAVNASYKMHKFCHLWAQSDEETPGETLTDANFYFKDRWDIWGEVM